jgi:circadian clock protein KaiB
VKTNKISRPSSVAALRRVDATKAVEKARATRPAGKYILQLYIAGATDRSRQAVLHVRQLCETGLASIYELEVIDIYQQPTLARDNQIVATPTLIVKFPQPVRQFIGNLSNIIDMFVKLDVSTKGKIAL